MVRGWVVIDLFVVAMVALSTFVLTRAATKAQCDQQVRQFLTNYLRLSPNEVKTYDKQGGWRAY
jgi:hypothetical protein